MSVVASSHHDPVIGDDGVDMRLSSGISLDAHPIACELRTLGLSKPALMSALMDYVARTSPPGTYIFLSSN